MFGILVAVMLIIIYIVVYKDHFISQFDSIVNYSLNPIYTNYHAREKVTPYGDDTIDLFLKRQLLDAQKLKFLV